MDSVPMTGSRLVVTPSASVVKTEPKAVQVLPTQSLEAASATSVASQTVPLSAVVVPQVTSFSPRFARVCPAHRVSWTPQRSEADAVAEVVVLVVEEVPSVVVVALIVLVTIEELLEEVDEVPLVEVAAAVVDEDEVVDVVPVPVMQVGSSICTVTCSRAEQAELSVPLATAACTS